MTRLRSISLRAGFDLPPNAKVVGWEPVEGTFALLPGFEERVATIPIVKGKLDALANAVAILQKEIGMASEARARDSLALLRAHSELNQTQFDDLLKAIRRIEAAESLDRQNLKQEMQRELGEFKAAACPVLRTASMDSITRLKLDSACR